MGVHTGEPHVGEEGYLGLDVVRAARISAAGHGGQILISETTRALLGNQLPEGVAVHDLGQQHLKDVQHEHIYELTIDGRSLAGKPLKTETPKSRGRRTWATRFEERINAYVEGQLESALDEAPQEGSARVADERRVAAEADRLVEPARRIRARSRRSPAAALLVQAAERERADRGAEAAAAELLAHAHRLELADPVLVVRPERGSRRRSGRPAPRRRSRARRGTASAAWTFA